MMENLWVPGSQDENRGPTEKRSGLHQPLLKYNILPHQPNLNFF